MSPSVIRCRRLIHLDDAGCTIAMVAPGWGANVIALVHQARDWAWPVPVLERVDLASVALKPTSYGMPILAPTPGRVGTNQNGWFRYAGRDYAITPARHGLVRDRAWTVGEASPDRIACEVDVDLTGTVEGGDAFPFKLRFTHTVRVVSAALHSTVAITNTGDRVQPVGVGWHPYLARSPAPCTVHLPAAHRWLLDGADEPTPTGELAPAAEGSDFRTGRVLDEGEHWDDVFTGLETDERGYATCWTEQRESPLRTDGRTERVRIRRVVRVCSRPADEVERPIPNVQLYTPPGRAAICLEPLSSPPNAINLAAGGHAHADVCELPPGETTRYSLEVGIEIEPDG